MAYLQARAGIARAGVTYAGWSAPKWQVLLNGSAQTIGPSYEELTITQALDGAPAECTFTVLPGSGRMTVPAYGNDLKILYTTPDDYLFAGTVVSLSAEIREPRAIYRGRAVDYRWLLDQYAPVFAKYVNVSVSTIVGDLLSNFADPAAGFSKGYLPSSLGTLSIEFAGETLLGALQRIAKAITGGAYLSVDASKAVSIFVTSPNLDAQTIGNSTRVLDVNLTREITQVRTRVYVSGKGTTASANTIIGYTTLLLDDYTNFSTSGGYATSGTQLFTYTDFDRLLGLRGIVGVFPATASGLKYQIAAGDEVRPVQVSISAGNETTLATALGGGLSGRASYFVDGGDITPQEAAGRAQAESQFFGTAVGELEYTTQNRWVVPGQIVTFSITSPITVSGTFQIQSITITPAGVIAGSVFDVWRRVTASTYLPSVVEILHRLGA